MRRTSLAFLDIVLLVLLLRHEPERAERARPVADYLLEVTWDHATNTDIDTYVMGEGLKVWFREKDGEGLVVLERDDLGHRNDAGVLNREQVAFRGASGIFWVGVHNYRGSAVDVLWELVSAEGEVVCAGVLDSVEHERPMAVIEIGDGVKCAPSSRLFKDQMWRR